jgi:hypothetical protein
MSHSPAAACASFQGAIRSKEAPLHRPANQWNSARRKSSDRFTTIVAANCAIVLGLIALALSVPKAAEWISAASQAEFAGSEAPAAAPTQHARPLEQMQVVRSE